MLTTVSKASKATQGPTGLFLEVPANPTNFRTIPII